MSGRPAGISSIYITTRCRTVDEFVTTFALFCHGPTCFFMTTVLHETGSVCRVTVALETGEAILRGEAQVIESVTAEHSPYGRTGMRLRFLHAEGDGSLLLARLMRKSANAATHATRRASVTELDTPFTEVFSQRIRSITTTSTERATTRMSALDLLDAMPDHARHDTSRLLRSDFEMLGGELQEVDDDAKRSSSADEMVAPVSQDRHMLAPASSPDAGAGAADDDLLAPVPKDLFDALPPELERLLECDVYTDEIPVQAPAPVDEYGDVGQHVPARRRTQLIIAAFVIAAGLAFILGMLSAG